MKQWLYYIGIIAAFLETGCEKTELDGYEGGSSIYFSIKRDTMGSSWGLVDSDIKERVLNLPIYLFGKVTDYDRKIYIRTELCEVDSVRAEENVDFKPIPREVILPAGEDGTILPIELIRTEILHEQNRMFTVVIEDSEDFDAEYNWRTDDNGNRYFIGYRMTIVLSEDFPKPNWWGNENRDFGYWSYKKADLICTLMDIPRVIFAGEAVGPMNDTRRAYYGKRVQRWLNDQDPPVMENDTTVMVMGPNAQEF